MRTARSSSPGREGRLLAVMFFAAGIVFLDRFGISYLFPQIGPELGLDNSQLGSLFAVTALAWAVSSVVFSVLSDRLGGRNKEIIVASLVLFSLAVGLVGSAPDYATLLALRAVIGLCEGPALPLILGIVAEESAPERRGRNMGVVLAGTAVIGSALTPVIMVGLAALVGWRLAFPAVALPGILVAAAVLVWVPPSRSRRTSADEARLRWPDVRALLRNRNLLLAMVGAIVTIGYTIGLLGFAPTFLAAAGLSPATSTLVLTVYGILAAVGNLLAPLVSDYTGRRPALLICAVCSAVVPLALVFLVHSVLLLVVSLVVVLMAGGTLGLITYVVPGESVPRPARATAFAITLAVGETVGGVLGPQVGGVIADTTHSLAGAMYLYAAAMAVLVVVTLLLRETAPRRVARPGSALTVIEESGEAVLP